ncbi:uncharacterized protein LOC112593664 [Melanaphis sacchari]|uniref:uncharacterized protein LOC112593664 n=1 Tax=Melanaphis sacchari TaxID=742174 RepID=UPI000DC13881|nr:uncharacterized protein LOC112593664 [Melanaphis sacchari]
MDKVTKKIVGAASNDPATVAVATIPSPAVTTALLLTAAVAMTAATGSGGGRTVMYPKYKSGGLVCYSDRRMDGGAFWSYANERQRRQYVFHCPSSLSAWCVNVATGMLSVRGCSGPTGVNRAGCFHVTDPELNATSMVCLCKRDYCNAAVAGTPVAWPLFFLALFVAGAGAVPQ